MPDTITIPLTRGYSAIIDAEDAEQANFKWHVLQTCGQKYGNRHLGNTKITLHQAILGRAPDGMVIDHIDGNGLNCRRSNLRVITRSENMHNRKATHGSANNPFPGVRQDSRSRRWYAEIHLKDQKYWLGSHATLELAIEARLEAEKRLWGIQPRRAHLHG